MKMDNSIVSACLFWIIFQVGHTAISTNPYLEALEVNPWKSVHNYVEVRPGAFIFYWLYYADGTDLDADEKPLIIWIQGGPGLTATGVGNFEEIGPLDQNWKPRNHTWVNGRNLLLIDHPVGTGFSYVTDESLKVTTDEEMVIDLAATIKGFLRNHKEFQSVPTYILGQSYGGKITPRLAYYLHSDIESEHLKMNLKGIGIGSGWVNPGESIRARPDFLYNMGAIDKKAYLSLTKMTEELSNLIDNNNYEAGYTLHEKFDFSILRASETYLEFLNLYNINQEIGVPMNYWSNLVLSQKVNTYVKPTLSHVVNQSMKWEVQSETVFYALNKTFLSPSTKFLEMLLNQTKIKIAVYNGNLDAVTPIAGAANWVHKLQWPGAKALYEAQRLSIRGHKNGFYKSTRQFGFWSVFGAGHWVPQDNPTAMHHILDYLIDQYY